VAAVLGVAVVVLAVAGVFSGGDDEPQPAQPAPIQGPQTEDEDAGARSGSQPKLETIRVGGRPTAVAAGPRGVWVADSFSPRASVLESESADAKPTGFNLDGPASDVTATESGAYYALPEQGAVERRQLADPTAPGESIELDGFPGVLAGVDGSVFALSDKEVALIDVDRAEAVERFELDGFASSLAAGEGFLWVAVDNREVLRLDPESGAGEAVEVPEAFSVATGEGSVWVVSASGEVTRIDPESLQTTSATVRGALDVAAGLGSVWVTSSRRSVTRLDPESLDPVGGPLRVGDEPAGVSVGDDAVWVANGGDGTLTRIEP
jgi:hypothetical protein